MLSYARFLASNPFLNHTWLRNIVSDEKRDYALLSIPKLNAVLHDPELIDINHVIDLWSVIVNRLHTVDDDNHVEKMNPFIKYPLLSRLYSECAHHNRQSFLTEFFGPVASQLKKIQQTASLSSGIGQLVVKAAARVQLTDALYDFHSKVLALEFKLQFNDGTYNVLSCKFGNKSYHDHHNGPWENQFYSVFTGKISQLKQDLEIELTRFGVYKPRITILNHSLEEKEPATVYYMFKEVNVRAYEHRKIFLDVIYGDGCPKVVPYAIQGFNSRLPCSLQSALDLAIEQYRDKSKMVSLAVYTVVGLFLAFFVWRVWNTYRKSNARNFWKRLMSNEAQHRNEKNANFAITFIYIAGAVFSLFTLLFDGVKNVSTVAGCFTSMANIVTKSSTGLLSYIRDDHTDDDDSDDEDDDDKKKKKNKHKSDKKDKKHKSHCLDVLELDSWGEYLPDVLDPFLSSNTAHADPAQPAAPVLPAWYDIQPTDKWSLIYKYPIVKARWLLATSFLWWAGLSLVVKIAIALMWTPLVIWIGYKLIRWFYVRIRNWSASNKSHAAAVRDVRAHAVLAQGEEMFRHYTNGLPVDAEWTTRFYNYINAKIKLGLPLSEEESQFLEIGDFSNLARDGRENRPEARPSRRNRPEAGHRRVARRGYSGAHKDYEKEDDDKLREQWDEDRDYLIQHKLELLESLYDESAEDRKAIIDEMMDDYERKLRPRRNPKAEPPGDVQNPPRGRHAWYDEARAPKDSRHFANGIIANKIPEKSIASFEVVRCLNKLRADCAAKGHKIPFPDWAEVARAPKSYMSAIASMQQFCKSRNIIIDKPDCPFCKEEKTGCILAHTSIRDVSTVKGPNKAESATRDHPSRLEHAAIGASVGCVQSFDGSGQSRVSTCIMTSSGILCNYHAIDGAVTTKLHFHGVAPVTVPGSHWKQCRRPKGSEFADVAVLEDIPKTINIPRIQARPVDIPKRFGDLVMISAKFNDRGDLVDRGYNINPGTFTGMSINCPPSNANGKMYPCGPCTASYYAAPGDSGGAVFDNNLNLIGIHCSGHDGQNPHNHFELLQLDLKNLKPPLNC